MLFRPFRSFTFGFFLPLSAAKLIARKKSLLILSALPIGITLALYWFLIQSLQDWAKAGIHDLIQKLGMDPNGWLAWLTALTFGLVLILVSAVTFAFSSSIVASPFNDLLAEKTENFSTPVIRSETKITWRRQLQLIGIDLLKALAVGVASVTALLLSWVPVLNFFAFALMFYLMTFQYISYPQTRRGIGLLKGAQFIVLHPFASLGFGLSISLLFAVPLLGGFVLPLAVVGGTLLFAACEKH